jgi:hypothetical protein
MKKLLLLLYIAMVAGLSISARASEQNLVVETLLFDANRQVVEVAGRFPNPCTDDVQIRLEAVKADTLALRFVGQQKSDFCAQMLGGHFSLAVDSRALKYELLRQGLRTDQPYRVVSPQGDLDEVIDFSNIIPQEFSSEKIEGHLQERNGSLSVETSSSAVSVASPFIDLAHLVGQPIVLFGHMNGASLLSANLIGNKRPEPLFIVTGASVIVAD